MSQSTVYHPLMFDMRRVSMILLCGGKGTRLSPLTDFYAKPYLPIGGKSRIVDFSLFNAVNSGLGRIFPILQYAPAKLNKHIADLHLNTYALNPSHIEGVSAFTGTAHAVYECMPEITQFDTEYVLVAPGDHVYKMDYRYMVAKFLEMNENDVDFMIAGTYVPAEQATEYGVMSVDENNILIDFIEKPEHPSPSPYRDNETFVSMGIYLCKKDFLYKLLKKDALDNNSDHDFGKDIITKLLYNSPGSIAVYDFSSDTIEGENGPFWMDVGLISHYFEAQMQLMDIVPKLNMNNNHWPIYVGGINIPPAKFNPLCDNMTGYENKRDLINIDFRMAEWEQIIPKMLLSGRTVIDGPSNLFSVVLSKNCRIGRFSRLNSVIGHKGVTIGEECSIYNTIIMSGCTIPNYTYVGFDKKRDEDRGVHIDKKSGIRVITPNSKF